MQPLEHVLLVDDDKHDNFFHTRALNKAGIAGNVHACQSVDEAISFLVDEGNPTPDLILLDINMPLKTGWDFLDAYESLSAARREGTKVVMLTSSENPSDKQRAARYALLAGYMTKPLTVDSVKQLMERHFSG